jgi:7-carboxy-7-deazaguanine synthase
MEKITAPIIDLHTCIQGEGFLMGMPHILVRTAGCNLRCAFANGICDTPYSSFKPDKQKYNLGEVDSIIRANPQIKYLMFTGGEPLLHWEFIEYMGNRFLDHFITVETNGTITPTDDLLKRVDLWSISPKMPDQLLTPEKAIIHNVVYMQRPASENISAIRKIIDLNKGYQLKYVVDTPEQFDAVESHILSIKREMDPRFIYLMPAGDTELALKSTRAVTADYCIKKGYSYTDRLQFVIYGNKRDA